MELENLIRDLVRVPRMLVVVGGEGCVGEMYCDSKSEAKFHGGWGMVESGSWHFHLKLDSVESAQFVEAEDHGAPLLYYVRFAGADGQTLLRCYFPNPFTDEHDKPVDFQPEKLKAFESIRDRYVGQKGITFVHRPKS